MPATKRIVAEATEKKTGPVLLAAEPDPRPVVDIDRASVDVNEVEGTEAAAPRKGTPFSLKIRGETYPMPRTGPLAPMILQQRQQLYTNALEARQRYLDEGYPEETANEASGFQTAQISMFKMLLSIFSASVPEEVLIMLLPEELGDLLSQFAPFAGGVPSASPPGQN